MRKLEVVGVVELSLGERKKEDRNGLAGIEGPTKISIFLQNVNVYPSRRRIEADPMEQTQNSSI